MCCRYSSLVEADVVSHKSNVKQLYFSKHKTQALFRLCFVTLYILIYNLKVSSNFHLTFLQYNVIIMFTVQEKLFFILLLGIFFELPITRTPDNSNFFRFPLKVWVIGSRLYLNGSLSRQEPPNLQSNLWLTSWTFLCFLTLFLLVHLPCMQCLLPAGWPHNYVLWFRIMNSSIMQPMLGVLVYNTCFLQEVLV